MSLFHKIKLSFNHSKRADIINMSSLISVPNNLTEEEKILLNKYKKEYISKIHNKKTMLSKEIITDEIHNKLNMYINLLLNICFDSKETNNKVDIDLKILKLRIYFNNILNLEKEVVIRINALKELIKEKVFLSHNKKQVLNYELSNLTNIYAIILSNKFALQKEIDTYLKKYENYDLNISKSEEKEIVNNKLFEISKYIKIVIPNYNQNNYQTISDLAYLEIACEKYVYDHKEDVPKLKEEYKKIVTRYSYWSIYNSNLLEQIEKEYLLFYKYSRGLITDKDMLDLYETKLLSYLEDDYDEYGYRWGIFNKEIITDKTLKIEQEYLEKAVMNLIEELVTDKYKYLEKRFGKNKARAIKYIIKILKRGDFQFNPEIILNDKLLINILICGLYPHKFDYLFKNYMIPAEHYKDTLTNNNDRHVTIALDSKISLDTMFKIDNITSKLNIRFTEFNLNEKDSMSGIYTYATTIKDIKKLYLLIHNPKNDFVNYSHHTGTKFFDIPKGITFISRDDFISDNNKILNELFKDIDGSVVVFPDSMRYISGDIFEGHEIKGIKIKNGLETIGHNALESQKLKEITIPSSVDYITGNAFNLDELDTIIFDNYEESRLISSEEYFKKFLSNIIIIERTGKVKYDSNNMIIGEELRINFKLYYIIFKKANYHKTINLTSYKIYRNFNRPKNHLLFSMEIEDINNITNYIYLKIKDKIYNHTGYVIGNEKNRIQNTYKELEIIDRPKRIPTTIAR